ncbi:hypothetical protein MSS93_03255 [Deinococcus radiodurans]|nr:hypothetical protein MSS93_03255 [Deinococcus radiodurans]
MPESPSAVVIKARSLAPSTLPAAPSTRPAVVSAPANSGVWRRCSIASGSRVASWSNCSVTAAGSGMSGDTALPRPSSELLTRLSSGVVVYIG